jgi:hypothetical protein
MNDPAHLLAENALLRLLTQLPQTIAGLMVETRVGNIKATLRIGNPGLGIEGGSTRKKEILDVVRQQITDLGRRITGAEVRTALQAVGHRWSGSTVNTALADLVADGLLVNANDKRGYGLPELPGSLAGSFSDTTTPTTKGES